MLRHEDAGVPAADRETRAREIAEYFGSDASYDRFRTHARPIRIEELRHITGLRIRALEEDDDFQHAVLSIYHAIEHTFGGAVLKIVENHRRARYVRILRQVLIQQGESLVPEPAPGTPSPKPPVPGSPTERPNRAERRRQQRQPRRRR